MAELQAEPNDTDAENGEAVAAPAKKKFGLKKILLFVVLPLLLIGGAGAAAYFMGYIGNHNGQETAMSAPGEEGANEADEEAAKKAVYYNLPDMIVNLQGERGRSTFLKISVSLELTDQKDVAEVERVLPRVVDNFQVYLRELRVDDLRGSAGLYRLREELLMRVSQAVAPVKVRDVLFKEMLVQ